MFRRMMVTMLSVGIFVSLIISASATQTGSIRVETNGGTVALYKVGDINGQTMRLFEEYGGGMVTEEDILSANLAAWLNEQTRNGQIKDTDLWGDTLFDGLSPGLYLLSQPSTPSGQTPFDPFLIVMPWDGYVWEINVDLELLPQTGSAGIPDIWIWTMVISTLGIGICIVCRNKIIV